MPLKNKSFAYIGRNRNIAPKLSEAKKQTSKTSITKQPMNGKTMTMRRYDKEEDVKVNVKVLLNKWKTRK